MENRKPLSTAMKNHLIYNYKKSLDCVDSISLKLMAEAFKDGLERAEQIHGIV